MQVEWYRSFAEAAKWSNLSKAADKLNMTQPAVSKHIRHLETAYGVELFRRSAAGVELTEAGKLFLTRLAPVLEALHSLDADMREFAALPGYRLGSLPSVAAQVLPSRLRDYHASGYPISVGVRISSEELAKALQEGTFDAVLLDSTYADERRQWSRELFTENYIAVLPDGHPLRTRATLSAADLTREPFVFSSHCDSLTRYTAVAERNGYTPDVKLLTDNIDYLLGVVAVGTGITVIPELFRKQAERTGLHAVPMTDTDLFRTIVLTARTADTGLRLYRLLAGPQPRQAEAN
jgi:DNA-binding transcriptional LysR family regulator